MTSKTVIQGTFIGGKPRAALQPTMRPGISRKLSPRVPTPPRTAHIPRAHGRQTVFPIETLPTSGPGRPLPGEIQAKMKAVFRADFSDVRVHVGPQAPSIGALAYTQGSNIHFAPGQYSPTTYHGQQLLGHELTHVLQQRSGRVRNPFGSGVAVVQDPAMEAEAEQMGMRAATYQVPVQAKISPVIQPMRRLKELQTGVGTSQITPDALKKVKARKYATQFAVRWFYDHGYPNPGDMATEAIAAIIARYGEFSPQDFDRGDHISLTRSYLTMMYELD